MAYGSVIVASSNCTGPESPGPPCAKRPARPGRPSPWPSSPTSVCRSHCARAESSGLWRSQPSSHQTRSPRCSPNCRLPRSCVFTSAGAQRSVSIEAASSARAAAAAGSRMSSNTAYPSRASASAARRKMEFPSEPSVPELQARSAPAPTSRAAGEVRMEKPVRGGVGTPAAGLGSNRRDKRRTACRTSCPPARSRDRHGAKLLSVDRKRQAVRAASYSRSASATSACTSQRQASARPAKLRAAAPQAPPAAAAACATSSRWLVATITTMRMKQRCTGRRGSLRPVASGQYQEATSTTRRTPDASLAARAEASAWQLPSASLSMQAQISVRMASNGCSGEPPSCTASGAERPRAPGGRRRAAGRQRWAAARRQAAS
mmetsp:Transcript_43886/g.136121  ORF Transcript_43886/g.136121 Transcript_43886/m.136121 type:complete len:376 (+) Transcript_43886:566-1693(+)